jgi:hypothetical protein
MPNQNLATILTMAGFKVPTTVDVQKIDPFLRNPTKLAQLENNNLNLTTCFFPEGAQKQGCTQMAYWAGLRVNMTAYSGLFSFPVACKEDYWTNVLQAVTSCFLNYCAFRKDRFKHSTILVPSPGDASATCRPRDFLFQAISPTSRFPKETIASNSTATSGT